MTFEDFQKTRKYYKRFTDYNPDSFDSAYEDFGVHIYVVDDADYYILEKLGKFNCDLGSGDVPTLEQAESQLWRYLISHQLVGNFLPLPSVNCVYEIHSEQTYLVDDDTGYAHEETDLRDIVWDWWQELSEEDFNALALAHMKEIKRRAPQR